MDRWFAGLYLYILTYVCLYVRVCLYVCRCIYKHIYTSKIGFQPQGNRFAPDFSLLHFTFLLSYLEKHYLEKKVIELS